MRDRPSSLVATADRDGQEPAEVRRRARFRIRPKRVLGAFALALLALSLLLVVAVPSVLSVRRHLLEGRRVMQEGRTQLLAGDTAAASTTFHRAEAEFALAEDASHHPALGAMGWLPVLGRTSDAVTGLAEAGRILAATAEDLSEQAGGLPGGLGALAPSGGRVPVTGYAELGSAVGRAAASVGEALDGLEATPGSLLLAPVREARREAIAELASARDTLVTASLLLDGVPRFLGIDGPQRYFFGAQSPAELRGTGGLMGAYAVLTIDGGRFRFSEFRPTGSLPDLSTSEVPPPNEDYGRVYDQYGGAGFWLNINMTPDFPSAAQAMLASYERSQGVRLDGVILVDPFALRALLGETGPTRIPELGVTVNAGTVVPFITNRAYGLFEDSLTRKLILGNVAREVVGRFLDQASGSIDALRVVAETASAGHLQVYSTDADLQRGLSGTSSGGSFGQAGGDFLSVIQNNAAGNKVDFYLDRSIAYSVRLEDGGAATSDVAIDFVNHAPQSGEPRYVIGPYPGVSEAGEVVGIAHVYCAMSCSPRGIEIDGRERDLYILTEAGHPFVRDAFTVGSGRTTQLDVSLRMEQAWIGNDSRGTYRLTIFDQTTIRPTTYRVEVVVPEGMNVVATTPTMEVAGNLAVWEGIVGRRLDLEVRFQARLPLRLWRDVVRFFSKPVIRL